MHVLASWLEAKVKYLHAGPFNWCPSQQDHQHPPLASPASITTVAETPLQYIADYNCVSSSQAVIHVCRQAGP